MFFIFNTKTIYLDTHLLSIHTSEYVNFVLGYLNLEQYFLFLVKCIYILIVVILTVLFTHSPPIPYIYIQIASYLIFKLTVYTYGTNNGLLMSDRKCFTFELSPI